MKKQERIKLDRNALQEQGYTRIKLIHIFDYYNDYKRSVTVYRAKKGKDTYFKYFFDNELNPNTIWEEVKKHITGEILNYHNDFMSGGIVYNVLVQENNKKRIDLISYHPINGIEIKSANYGET